MDMSGVSSPSMTDQLARLGTSQASGNVQSQIATAVAKQIQDTEKLQGEMIVKLIQNGPSPDPAVGRNLDRSA